MATEHFGISHEQPSGKPRVKLFTGHFGISFFPSEKPVFIEDSNGRGLKGVTVTALNAVTGNRSAITDTFGSTALLVEDNTTILVTKDNFTFEFQFAQGNRVNYVIDLPIISY
jgi:hypothetical protein